MQLPNMELDPRVYEALRGHGIPESLTLLFLKSCLKSSAENKEAIFRFLTNCFELPASWMSGNAEIVFQKNEHSNSIRELIDYLIHCKQSGWKPKLLFVKSNFKESAAELDVLIFVELKKITETGIAFTTYKHWDPSIWEITLTFCQQTPFFYQGWIVDPVDFQDLKNGRVIPATALKKTKNIWFPATKNTVEHAKILEKITDQLEILKITAMHPTYLHKS